MRYIIELSDHHYDLIAVTKEKDIEELDYNGALLPFNLNNGAVSCASLACSECVFEHADNCSDLKHKTPELQEFYSKHPEYLL